LGIQRSSIYWKNFSPFFRYKVVSPLASQQFECQQDIADKVLFVEGGWRCNFFFRVEATQRDLQHEWTTVEIRVCPAPFLSAIRQQHFPLIFQATSPQAALWMSMTSL